MFPVGFPASNRSNTPVLETEVTVGGTIQRADREDALESHPNTWGSSRYQ